MCKPNTHTPGQHSPDPVTRAAACDQGPPVSPSLRELLGLVPPCSLCPSPSPGTRCGLMLPPAPNVALCACTLLLGNGSELLFSRGLDPLCQLRHLRR